MAELPELDLPELIPGPDREYRLLVDQFKHVAPLAQTWLGNMIASRERVAPGRAGINSVKIQPEWFTY